MATNFKELRDGAGGKPPFGERKTSCLELLQQVPLFTGIEPSKLTSLLDECRLALRAPDSALVNRGDPPAKVIVIIHGLARVERSVWDITAGEVTSFFNYRGPGEHLAVNDLVKSLKDPNRRHRYSTRACSPCGVIEIPSAHFLRVYKHNPGHPAVYSPKLAENVADALIDRLDQQTEDDGWLMALDKPERVVFTLYQIARASSRTLVDDDPEPHRLTWLQPEMLEEQLPISAPFLDKAYRWLRDPSIKIIEGGWMDARPEILVGPEKLLDLLRALHREDPEALAVKQRYFPKKKKD